MCWPAISSSSRAPHGNGQEAEEQSRVERGSVDACAHSTHPFLCVCDSLRGIASKGTAKSYLPENKQYLITRNVPSLRRAHTYALSDAQEEVIKNEGAGASEEGWLSTHSEHDMAKNREVQDIDDVMGKPQTKKANAAAASTAAATSSPAKPAAAPAPAAAAPVAAAAAAADDEVGDIDDLDADMSNLVVKPTAAAAPVAACPPAAAAAAAPAPAAAAAAEEFPDMEAFDGDDDNVLAPPTAHDSAAAAAASSSSSRSFLSAEEPEDNLVKTRTYDISITYDKYYRTPRVYLFGYDEHRQPLTADQIMEDISSDHANKTVTVESHPYLGVAHASIHPCKHAHVMKRIVDQMSQYQAQEGSHGAAKKIDVKQSVDNARAIRRMLHPLSR